MTDSALVLLGKRIVLFWALVSVGVLGVLATGYAPQAYLGALTEAYSTVTTACIWLAGVLLGLETSAAGVITALRGPSK